MITVDYGRNSSVTLPFHRIIEKRYTIMDVDVGNLKRYELTDLEGNCIAWIFPPEQVRKVQPRSAFCRIIFNPDSFIGEVRIPIDAWRRLEEKIKSYLPVTPSSIVFEVE